MKFGKWTGWFCVMIGVKRCVECKFAGEPVGRVPAVMWSDGFDATGGVFGSGEAVVLDIIRKEQASLGDEGQPEVY